MFKVKDSTLKILDSLIKANFTVAVIVMIAVSVFAMTDSQILFQDSSELDELSDLYGPLANNLRLILVYVGIVEANLLIYCWSRQKQQILLWVGIFYLLMIGGFAFYGEVNQIPIDGSYNLFFLYQGISHILLGGSYLLPKIYPRKF